ncbi:MAG: hypothetical protein LBJ14_01565 [Desulfarculales bacterium]|jgi:hypothetical protein|nr:hypothetical protein [Desulfarculales bacterium]
MKSAVSSCFLLTIAITLFACVPQAVPEDPAPAPRPQAIAAPAPPPDRAVIAAPPASQRSLGALGLNVNPPQGMCWPEIDGRDARLYARMSEGMENLSLQPLALALSCGQLEAWRAGPDRLPSSYVFVAQKMDARVGGGGAGQAKERWIMVQSLGGNFGFYPQEQYGRMDYLKTQAAKLAPGEMIQLGEIRRDEMALYTVSLRRPASGGVQFVLSQYSQLRGTPVVISWHQPLEEVDSLSRRVLASSSWLALLVRQSDEPASASPAPAGRVVPAADASPSPAGRIAPAADEPASASPAPAPAVTPSPLSPAYGDRSERRADAGQIAAENLVAARSAAARQKDVTGWEKASFGLTLAQLGQAYDLDEAWQEEVRGQAYYLKDKFAAIGGMQFRVLFDFSESPLGEGNLGRIIFSNTTGGGSPAFQKSSLLNTVNSWYGLPSQDDSRAGGPVLWQRDSGQASLQMITGDAGTVWLLVLEARQP